jgi:(p)ppGpp synthase/HD superfamily hydrolase
MITKNKLVDTYRKELRDAGHLQAARALGFASTYHTGSRLDGSPEISHQIEIARYLRTLSPFKGFERALVVAMLHDVREDYDVHDCVLRSLFGAPAANDVAHLTKVFKGISLPVRYAFSMAGRSPISAIVKGADRIHNLKTMDDAFSEEKQASYRREARTYILPMLRSAREVYRTHSVTLTQIIRDLEHLSTPITEQTKTPERTTHDA